MTANTRFSIVVVVLIATLLAILLFGPSPDRGWIPVYLEP
jgi:hypothetical protein